MVALSGKRDPVKRLLWLDITRGLAILCVVYFHFFSTYFEHGSLPAADWSGAANSLVTFFRLAWLKLSGLGFHSVGVFIILTGWVLTQSTARRAERGELKWRSWYLSRFFRLYPMYWVAHLVYLLSPFVARLEPIDGRILLSLLGLRFIDITMNFMYLNAAWWYFSMLLQFYVIFPILFLTARRLGPSAFLLLGCLIGFAVRYLMLIGYPQNGLWILGGFAICRLPEFALGMALGIWQSQAKNGLERFLLNGPGLITGIAIYPAALQLYRNGYTYVVVDFATGACCGLVLVGLAGIVRRLPPVANVIAFAGVYSYGIFLTHQPYVIWLGLRIQQQSIGVFLLFAAVILVLLVTWGALLEKGTNRLVELLLRRIGKTRKISS